MRNLTNNNRNGNNNATTANNNNNDMYESPNPFLNSEENASSLDYQASNADSSDEGPKTNLLHGYTQFHESTNYNQGSRYYNSNSNNGTRMVSSASFDSTYNPNQRNFSRSGTGTRNGTPSPSQSDPFLLLEDTLSPFGGFPIKEFPLSIDEKEPDDYLHNPDPIQDALYDKHRFWNDLKTMDRRSLSGLIGFICLLIGALCVFVLLPVLTYSGATQHYTPQVYEILTQYEYPLLSAIRTSLVDFDTPSEAQTIKNKNGQEWKLVFSDEFNAEGRTFYDGDDQFFTAPDLHYQATQDLEWYDPDAVTTLGGALNLRMDAFKNHNLFYRSGMVQSWNKMCFTEGLIQISASLPGYGNVPGLWPGMWTLGNLGRPGYMATTEGVWPYTYDSCDAGITPNQSSPDGISYLPGQKLNSCTCKGEDHPNPGVGRGAPEIDIIEAEMNPDTLIGVASQSLQIAPMDIWYMPNYDFISIFNSSVTTMNTYAGGPFQQAVSGTTVLNRGWYEYNSDGKPGYQNYGFEYLNDDSTGYITWYVGEDPTITLAANSLQPNGNIGWRRIPKEPLSIVMNLGISNSWSYINWNALIFPLIMRIDYVRVYQPEDAINLTCDPPAFPTYQYIQSHLNAYSNVNLTSWELAGYTFPKNKLTGGCK